MKIVLLNSERGWRGGEAQTLLLATGLRALGHTVTIGCPENSALAERTSQEQLLLFHLKMKGSLSLSSIFRLRKWCKEQQPDIVHAQTAHAHSAAALALYGLPIPLVVSRRVNFPLSNSGFTRWKYSRARAITAISRAVQTTLQTSGVSVEKISIIPDGVVVPEQITHNSSALCQELHIPSSTRLVLCIANLSHEKDHETLLRAWQHVETKQTGAHLVLVGDGERKDDLIALAQTLTLKDCHFIGFKKNIADLLGAAYVVVLTSRAEGLGSILLEAQAREVPIVATTAGGIPEAVINEKTGLLVPVGDSVACAAALLKLLQDNEMHQRFSQAARQHCEEHFSAQAIVDAHQRLYQQLLTS